MSTRLSAEELDKIERNAASIDPANHEDDPYVVEQAQDVLVLVAEVKALWAESVRLRAELGALVDASDNGPLRSDRALFDAVEAARALLESGSPQ